MEKLRNEIERPHMVGFLFDTPEECLEVVKGLHGFHFVLHEAMTDADILFQWNQRHQRTFEVDRREDRKAAVRYRLSEPPKVSAPDVYDELLGMDVKLRERVSKANYRLQVRFPSSSKADIENAGREYWLSVLVGFLEEANLPVVKIARATSNPNEILRRAFGTRRMKTLRNRARTWAKVREWLIMFFGEVFPRDAADMLEYLLFLVQEDASKGRLQDTASALAVLEEAGQVASDMKISGTMLWVQGVKSRLAEIELGKTQVKRAPPPSVGMLISLELSVASLDLEEYFRAMAWVILLCAWGCLRLADLEGLDPNRLSLGSRGLRGVLVRTKTTGPGKQVKETPIFLSRRLSLTGVDWMRIGFDLWEGFGHKDRDYFVMATDSKMSAPLPKYAPTEKVSLMVRQVFLGLRTPAKPRYKPWTFRGDEEYMLDSVGAMYWTGHSMRHFLPTVAASIDIGKEQRDYVGRWHVNLHQSADYVHTSRQIVIKVQESVNKAICEGTPSYDESELMEDFECFMVGKGRPHVEAVKPHCVWKKIDGGVHIGGKWPTMDVDVIDAEIWAEHGHPAPADEDVGPGDLDKPSDQEERQPSFFVTISRHSGFRRLHRVGGCGVQPWTCHKVEYITKVVDGIADAACKACQRRSGKVLERVESSSSGTSSSTDLDLKEVEESENFEAEVEP